MFFAPFTHSFYYSVKDDDDDEEVVNNMFVNAAFHDSLRDNPRMAADFEDGGGESFNSNKDFPYGPLVRLCGAK